MKSELELVLNKLSTAQRTGEPVALTPKECEHIIARIDELIAAIEGARSEVTPEARMMAAHENA